MFSRFHRCAPHTVCSCFARCYVIISYCPPLPLTASLCPCLGGVIPSPFEHCDVVTTTTHKSLRGPRGAMIFFRKGERYPAKKAGDKPVMYDLEEKINFAVFPGLQVGVRAPLECVCASVG